MIYKVSYRSDINKLLSLPESGMGYQIVEGNLVTQYETKRYVVYNAQMAIDLDDKFTTNKNQLFLEGYSVVLGRAQSWGIKTESISMIPKELIVESRYLSDREKTIYKRKTGGKSAKDNPKENANGNDVFVRISAYEDDTRVDSVNKKLLDGTYTTTQADYLNCVGTSDDPLDRYALPNNDKINWSFYIQPNRIDILQRGIVQPAFGHDGGGEEVFFEKGTSKGTLLSTRPYGQ